MDRDERVSVTLDDTLLLPTVIAGRTCCHHCEVSLISKLQHFEKLVRVLDAIVMVRLRWNTHDVRGCKAGQTPLRASVGAMELGPSFLQDGDPELAISARCEGSGPVAFAGKIVVDDDRLLIAIDEHLYHVNACSVDLFGHKHRLDSLFKLRQRAQCSQKITVAQLPLIDVIRMNAALKHLWILKDLTCSPP